MKVAIKENEVFPESRWEDWTEDVLINDIYKFTITECDYDDCEYSDFDFIDDEYIFNKNKYDTRHHDEHLDKMRCVRSDLLRAFDIYKSNIEYGIITETEESRNEMLNWYRNILDLNEESFVNIPNGVKKYM